MYFDIGQWDEWFANYKEFARHYAIVAQRAGAEQIAIGAELIACMLAYLPVINLCVADLQEHHWREVIAEVRQVYKGTLTYACNFGVITCMFFGVIDFLIYFRYGSRFSCFNVTWWDALDLIGVDAYFPIAPESSQPTYDQLKDSWPIAKGLKQLSQKYGKHLIFTEIGYPSQNGANVKPNKWDANAPANCTIQSECYRGNGDQEQRLVQGWASQLVDLPASFSSDRNHTNRHDQVQGERTVLLGWHGSNSERQVMLA